MESLRTIESVTFDELKKAYDEREDFRDYVNGIIRKSHEAPESVFDNYMVKEYYLYLLHKDK